MKHEMTDNDTIDGARRLSYRSFFAAAAAILVVVLVVIGCGRVEENASEPVSPAIVGDLLEGLPADWALATSQEVLENKPFLLDVRDAGEFATGFIEGAINIPLRSLAKELDTLPGMDEEIVVVCCSGPRSTVAMTTLRALGFRSVSVLGGGMAVWRSALLPVVGGPVPPLPTGAEHAIDPDLLAAVDRFLSDEMADDWGMVDVQDLRQQLDEGQPLVLDVRQPGELADGQIEGALNIPLRELAQHFDMIPRDREVTVVDASGYRSTIVMAALQMMGYPAVTSLSGGMIAWQATGADDEEFHAIADKIQTYLADLPSGWGLITLADLADSDPFLLDVRSADAFGTGYVDGAVNVPLRELTRRLGVLPALEEPIVVISDSGTESAIGMMALQLLGYQQVSSLSGGIQGWESAGHPLARESVSVPAGAAPEVDPAVLQALDQYLTVRLPDDYALVDGPGLLKAMEDSALVATTVIDVRQASQFAIDGFEGAYNLPLEGLLEGLDEIPAEPLRTS